MSRNPTRDCHPSRVTWSLVLIAMTLAVYWFAGCLALDSVAQLHDDDRAVNALKLICALVVAVMAACTAMLVLLFTFGVRSLDE